MSNSDRENIEDEFLPEDLANFLESEHERLFSNGDFGFSQTDWENLMNSIQPLSETENDDREYLQMISEDSENNEHEFLPMESNDFASNDHVITTENTDPEFLQTKSETAANDSAIENNESEFLPMESDAREPEIENEDPKVEIMITNSAFGNRIREFDLVNFGYVDLEEFLLNCFSHFQQEISKVLKQFKLIKTISYLSADFERAFVIEEQSDPLFEKRLIHIPTRVKEISSATNIEDYFQTNVIEHVKRKIEEALVEGSGFTLSKIHRLTVQVFKYEPLQGGGDIDLPQILKNKKAIINLKNTNDECFKWSILAALHHDEMRKKRIKKVNDATSYKLWSNELNFDGIEFPMQLTQIEKFMAQNEDIAINVYYYDSEKNVCVRYFLQCSLLKSNTYICFCLQSS